MLTSIYIQENTYLSSETKQMLFPHEVAKTYEFSIKNGMLFNSDGKGYRPRCISSIYITHSFTNDFPAFINYHLTLINGMRGIISNHIYCGDDAITSFMTELFLLKR